MVEREIGILMPNNQRQHRTLHIQKDVLPYACISPDGGEVHVEAPSRRLDHLGVRIQV